MMDMAACTQHARNTGKPLPTISAFFPNRKEQESSRAAGNSRETGQQGMLKTQCPHFSRALNNQGLWFNKSVLPCLQRSFPALHNPVKWLGSMGVGRLLLAGGGSEGVVIQPFHFPPTKQIWWNLRLLVNEKTIRLAVKHLNQSSSPYECFLIGSVSIDSREEAVEINIDRFDPGRDFIEKKGGAKRKVPTTVVPGDQIIPLTLIKGLSGAEDSVTHSKKEFQRTLEILYSRISGQDALNLCNFLSLKSTCHAHVDDNEIILNLHFGAVSIVTSILATPVNPVPIIPTALARNLTGPLRLSDVQGTPKCGFLTMDHTRKLLLLLESDPKAYSLPLIGVWVSGPFTIHHPYIWSCCLRFLHSTAVQERVLASPNTFLLVHYSPAQTNPIFWECSPQAQLQEGLFELYSCYENLHLDQISAQKYTEPLCFELLSPGDTMNRALFNQAVNSWTKELQNNSSERKDLTQAEGKLDNNIGSLEPRPSPSPHPQMTQSPNVISSIPEVSLSLSFEESSFLDQDQDLAGKMQNGRFFPDRRETVIGGKDGRRILHQKNGDQNILKRNTRKPDQENRTPMTDPRYANKQALVERTPIGSPQREPLKPITGHLNHIQNPRSQNVSTEGKRLGVPPNGKEWVKDRGTDGGYPKATVNVPGPQKGPPRKALTNRGMSLNSKGRGSSIKPRDNERTNLNREERREIQGDRAQRRSMTREKSQEANVPVTVEEDQNHQQNGKENIIYEKSRVESNDIMPQQQHGTSSQEANSHKMDPMDEECISDKQSDIEVSQLESKQENHQLNYDSFNSNEKPSGEKQISATVMPNQIDTLVYHHHQHSDKGNNSKHNESGMDQSVFCDSGVGDSTRDVSYPEEDDQGQCKQNLSNLLRQEDIIPPNEKKTRDNQSRPDPYDLIMKQEQQLKELQHQINLLLLQQSLTQNTPVGIPTPPPTPVSTKLSPTRPRVTKVTMGTNTGASLLMSSPVFGRGRVSKGTSPIRKAGRNEDSRRRLRTENDSSSTSSQYTNSDPTQTNVDQSSNQHVPDPTVPKESTPSSRQSLDSTTDEELDEQCLVIERLNDTNITLASSIHGVDICEFVGSPESTGGQPRTSDLSPVLGESASMIMQQQQDQGTETPNDDHHFHSLLYKNEKLFYDSLLSKVNKLLCEKVDKSDQTPDTSHDATQYDTKRENEEDDVIHEPTRQEVLMATFKELERIKGSSLNDIPSDANTAAVKEVRPHDTFGKSSFIGVLPDHPRINYLSMSNDETLDETIVETESLALKYLNKEQLQEYRQLVSNCHGNRGRGFTRGFSSAGLNIGRGVNDVDCTWNNLSMATQDYLQRYNLVGRKKETNPTRNGDSHVNGARVPGQNREESIASIHCSAPPSTPEPRHTETRILDIQRLKNLPKLL